jgi:hypothetical protein
MAVKILCGALDESTDGAIVLRGVIDPASLTALKNPAYQREGLPENTRRNLLAAFADGQRVPDVELAVRGRKFECSDKAGVFTLGGDIYIVDGLQRITAGTQFMASGGSPLIGATIHFGTTEQWERDRFKILNLERIRVSNNVLLKNRAAECTCIKMLYDLTLDSSFPMHGRVCWEQYMRRSELVSAITYVKIASHLHSRFGAGRFDQISRIQNQLPVAMAKITRSQMRANVVAFFALIEDCWGITKTTYRQGVVHLSERFLKVLAKLLSEHTAFWEDSKLTIGSDLKKKIRSFPITDKEFGVSVSSHNPLVAYQLLINHINSGKRTGRLVKFL